MSKGKHKKHGAAGVFDCSFCGDSQLDANLILVGDMVAICDVCVEAGVESVLVWRQKKAAEEAERIFRTGFGRPLQTIFE